MDRTMRSVVVASGETVDLPPKHFAIEGPVDRLGNSELFRHVTHYDGAVIGGVRLRGIATSGTLNLTLGRTGKWVFVGDPNKHCILVAELDDGGAVLDTIDLTRERQQQAAFGWAAIASVIAFAVVALGLLDNRLAGLVMFFSPLAFVLFSLGWLRDRVSNPGRSTVTLASRLAHA